ncbi:MAG: hypothetical protein PHN51_01730 [Candidatus Nanopelagicales bacterium]|nr:hypothetical protein [Candidatus Nanopelagicales bacterium]
MGSHCSGISVASLVGATAATPGTAVLMPVEMTITESKTIKVLCRRERRKNPIIIFTLEKRMASKPSFTLETKLSLTSR